jgi:hypothetical protein
VAQIGSGIKGFQIREHPEHQSRCLFVMRTDNTMVRLSRYDAHMWRAALGFRSRLGSCHTCNVTNYLNVRHLTGYAGGNVRRTAGGLQLPEVLRGANAAGRRGADEDRAGPAQGKRAQICSQGGGQGQGQRQGFQGRGWWGRSGWWEGPWWAWRRQGPAQALSAPLR